MGFAFELIIGHSGTTDQLIYEIAEGDADFTTRSTRCLVN